MQTVQCPKCNNTARHIANNPQRTLYRCVQCRGLIEIPHVPNLAKQLRFLCFNHQGKADKLVSALCEKYEQHHGAVTETGIYFCLTDSDVSGRASQLRRMGRHGVRRFFIYPHTARPSLVNTVYPVWEGTTAQFVVNEYHEEVLRAYGYEKPIEHIGWHLSPVEEFKPRHAPDRPLRVLFAPIHPRNAEIDRQVNKATFERLYKHVLSGEIELTIRHIGQVIESGFDVCKNVKYVNGKMNQATDDMEAADVVIGHQTFAWLAVARGFPTVMFAEDMPTHFRINNKYNDVPCWNSVYHLFRYPLDILCEDDTMALLRRAAVCDKEIRQWKLRMIGVPFCAESFIEKVERYL